MIEDGRGGSNFKILNLVARENVNVFNTELRRAGLGAWDDFGSCDFSDSRVWQNIQVDNEILNSV